MALSGRASGKKAGAKKKSNYQPRAEKKHNCPAVPQMRERGLRAIARLCEQADDKADAVLLDSYKKGERRQQILDTENRLL